MLFWIFMILLVVGIVLWVLNDSVTYGSDVFMYIGCTLVVIFGLVVFVSGIIIAVENITAEANKASFIQQYDAIVYEIESGLYTDEFDIMDRTVLDKASDWNSDLVAYQKLQNDFWVGIYIPDIYADLNTIDYKTIKSD
jgi:hypothetical protein